MKTIRMFTKITVIALAICLLGALASCGLSGSLKMESFTVLRSSVKTSYYVGEAIDFSGIKAIATYSDESLNKEYGFADLTIEYPDDITATVGNKEVSVSFMDPHLNVKQETKVAIVVMEDPNAIKHDGYKVDTEGMKTAYLVGDSLDFTGIKLFETFTNGGADVEITDLSDIAYDYDQNITATTGQKNITVTYKGESAGVIAITVSNPAIVSVTLDTANVPLDYMKGDVVTLDGLSALFTYENGETRTVTAFESKVNLSTLTAECGQKEIVVQFNDPISGDAQTASFQIKVDGMISYVVDTHNMTLTYDEGALVSFAGIKVTATYYFGHTEEIPFEELSFLHEDNLTADRGNKLVTVMVGDNTAGQFIIVVGDIPVAFPLLNGIKTSYRVGETISVDGLSVELQFEDATQNCTIPFEQLTVLTDLTDLGLTAGEKEISVQYLLDGETPILAKVLITVWGIDSYTVNTEGMKTTYIVGDTLDYSGLSVLANYRDRGDSVPVDLSTVRFEDADITTVAGQKSILLYVGDTHVGTISITVEKNAVISQVIGGDFNTVFEEGKTADLDGLTLTLTYKNGQTLTFTLAELNVSAVNTSKLGTQTVTVKVMDPINNEEINVSFNITVIAARLPVVQYETTDELSQFQVANNNAGKLSYGQSGFSTQFAKKAMYVIGDDNEFKLIPKFSVMEAGLPKPLAAFFASVEMFVYDGSTYVAMQKVTDPQKPTMVSFSYNGTVMVTADTYYGTYDFTADAVGKQVKFSILPSATYYVYENLNPVTLEAKIIDAYNVTAAWQLAVADCDTNRTDWVEFKASHGLTDLHPAGIVFHNDIHVSADDIPQQFLYVSDKPITYKNALTGETTIAPVGTRYLKDELFIYSRTGSSDFTIQGNFFTLDVIKFPLVPSPAVFDESLNYDYGMDFSNSALFAFATEYHRNEPQPADVATITVENVSSIGNAGRNNYVDAQDGLVSAGGLFFVKIRNWADVTISNSHFNSFFITALTEMDAVMTLNDIKCYDSYQNALFVWGSTTCTVRDSFFNGAGGPLVLCQPVFRDQTWYNPIFTVNNSKTETHLTGEEIWFGSLPGVSAVVSDIKALGAGLAQTGMGNFVDGNGKMNIVEATIPNISDGAIDATEMIKSFDMQATMLVNGHGLNRWQNDPFWSVVYNHPAFRQMAPFLTVNDAAGNTYAIFFNGTTFCDIMGNPLGTMPEHAALVAAFQSADHITLSQGGLSVILEFYHTK